MEKGIFKLDFEKQTISTSREGEKKTTMNKAVRRSNQDCGGPESCILGVVVGEWRWGSKC